MIKAYIRNTANGQGDWLRFPATESDAQDLFARIGLNNAVNQDYSIDAYVYKLLGLDGLDERTDINELNYFASLLNKMGDDELSKFEAAAELGLHNRSVKDMINLAKNLDCYEYCPSVSDYDELGQYLIQELACETIPESIEKYFNYEGYGIDYVTNAEAKFTYDGFVFRNGAEFKDHYDGLNVPKRYRIRPTIRPDGKEDQIGKTHKRADQRK